MSGGFPIRTRTIKTLNGWFKNMADYKTFPISIDLILEFLVPTCNIMGNILIEVNLTSPESRCLVRPAHPLHNVLLEEWYQLKPHRLT